MDLMSSAHVALRRLDEALLEALAATAAADADPHEVMPPTGEDGPGWTAARREAFVRFHRSRSLGADPAETVYAVLVTEPGPDGRPREAVAGAARLAPAPEPGAVEAGLWLGRSHRGRGVGTAVLALLLNEARATGATGLIARTDAAGPRTAASRRLLAAAGAGLETGGDGTVTARLPLTGRPRPA